MTEYEKWLGAQDSIYEKFTAGQAEAKVAGLLADKAVTYRLGGYLVGLRPSEQVCELLEEVEEEIGLHVDYASYGMGRYHTTMSDYRVSAHRDPRDDDDHVAVLEKLCMIAQRAANSPWAPHARYTDPLFNRTTVIVGGIPNAAFLAIADHAVATATQYDIDLRRPWGAHSTIGRFTQDEGPEVAVDLSEQFEQYRQDFQRLPLQPFRSVIVGHFRTTPAKFDLEIVEEYPLQP